MCCRGPVIEDKSLQAGQWGDFNCDLPPWTLEFIDLNEADFVIWTGDNVAHVVEKTPLAAVKPTLLISQYMKKNFPNKVVIPIQGNHEFSPMNLQDMTLHDKDEQI